MNNFVAGAAANPTATELAGKGASEAPSVATPPQEAGNAPPLSPAVEPAAEPPAAPQPATPVRAPAAETQVSLSVSLVRGVL